MRDEDISDALDAIQQAKINNVFKNIKIGNVTIRVEQGYETSWIGMIVGTAVIVTIQIGKNDIISEGDRDITSAINKAKSKFLWMFIH